MFELKKIKKFQNQRITRVITSPFQKVICAFGPKFIYILDHDLVEKGKIILENPNEIVVCAKFLRISKEYGLKNIEKRAIFFTKNSVGSESSKNSEPLELKTNTQIPISEEKKERAQMMTDIINIKDDSPNRSKPSADLKSSQSKNYSTEQDIAVVLSSKSEIFNRSPNYKKNEEMNASQLVTSKEEIQPVRSTTTKNKESYKYSFLLALAGEAGSIKIIDLYYPTYKNILKGHGSRIINLLNHPIYEHIIFSCSADTTIRMWDLRTNQTSIIFGGLCGHEDLVLCFDISQDGQWLVSGGSDNCIKIWEIPLRVHSNLNIPKRIHFPRYSSQILHKTYINYIKFYGKIIISKNVSNRVSIFIFEDMVIEKNESDICNIVKRLHSYENSNLNEFEIDKNNGNETEINNKSHKENLLPECEKYNLDETISERKNLAAEFGEKILTRLVNEKLFLTDLPNKPIKNQEINFNFVYKTSFNSKTMVISDYKFKNKLVQKFATFNNQLIIMENTGGCHIIDLDNFQKKTTSLSEERITDIAVIENKMYLVVNCNTIQYREISEL